MIRRFYLLSGLVACALGLYASADTLGVGSANGAAGSTIQLPFNFTNTNQIVGLQLDLITSVSTVHAGLAATPSSGLIVSSREISAGRQRVVLCSPTNATLPSNLLLNIPLTLSATSPAGGPSVIVRNIILTNRQGQTFTPSLNYKALDQWRQQHFSVTEQADASLIGDDKDPDGDGVPNLLEFLMGTDPRAKNASGTLQSAIAPQQVACLTMTFRSARNLSGTQFFVESSKDLMTWSNSGVALSPTGVTDAATLEYRAALPMAGEPKQFLRIRAKRTNGISQPGDEADPDGDGIPSLLELVMGTNPGVRNSQSPFQSGFGSPAIPCLSMTYRAAKNITAAQLFVESSKDLQTWTRNGITLTPTGAEDAATIEYRAYVPIVGEPKRFLRLSAIRTPGN